MSKVSTFSILFWIYSSRAINYRTNIHARVTIDGVRANISLNQKIDIRTWDAKKQRIKGNGVKSREINLYLDVIKSELVKCYRDLQSENRIVTPQIITSRFLGNDKKHHSLKDIFKYHNDLMENKHSAKTQCHYRTSQKYILLYISEILKVSDLNLHDLNYAFVIGFESFLRGFKPEHYRKQIGNNAVMKHIQRLKRMISVAYDIEWINSNPFNKFKLKLEKKERDFLTRYELSSIEELSIKIERLQIVKDLFIFSCYTGISYSDIMDLTEEHIIVGIDGNKWIMSNRNKTGTPFKIPLLKKAEDIIHKYRFNIRTIHSGKLLPTLSNQKLNSYLKEIADLSGITKNLTFHMGRHTFATTVTLTNGVPIETVSKLLGHTKLSTTQIYARVIEKKIGMDMELLKLKLA